MHYSHEIVAERRTLRNINAEKVHEQVKEAVTGAMASNRGSGWKVRVFPVTVKPNDNGYVYTVKIGFRREQKRESLLKKWPVIVKAFACKASRGSLKASPWKVLEPTGFAEVAERAKHEHSKAVIRKEQSQEPKTLGEIHLEPHDCFSRIYDRDAQIARIRGSLDLAKRTGMVKRVHSLLNGEPGCGKTEICKAFSQSLGEEKKDWLWFDATSMSKAGVIEELMNSDFVPPVLFIEEIEKTDENSLRWLLGIMDTRGQIRRTNYRVGNQAKEVRMVIIATVNDVALLKSVMAGALYSRFANKIYCPRPDRVIMKRILEREITEIKGKPEWIEPTLKFAFDKWGMTDPRDVITICSCGGDMLLDNSYQRDYEKTMNPMDLELLLKSKDIFEKERREIAQISKSLENWCSYTTNWTPAVELTPTGDENDSQGKPR